MKFNYFKAGLIIFISLFLTSCEDTNCINGAGGLTTRTLNLSNFTGIDMAIAADVLIQQGAAQNVEVTGHVNVLDRLDTDVSDGVWGIEFRKDCYKNYDLSVIITVPDINKVFISGSGDVEVNNFINQNDLRLDISGSGNIILNDFEDSEKLEVNISGSGKIFGNSDFTDLKRIDISISGSGTYNAYPIRTDDCNINISGSGNCFVYVSSMLNVNISGSGNVYYKGNPTVTTNISGSGNVIDSN